MRRLATLAAALLLVACAQPSPPPAAPAKPVATAEDACGAALAYAAGRIAKADSTVEASGGPLVVAQVQPQMPKALDGWQGTAPPEDWFAGAMPLALPADCGDRLARLRLDAGPPGKWSETDRLSPPLLSADGREALVLASEGCGMGRCLQGTATYLRKDAAGVWRVVGQTGLWIS